MFAYQIPNCLAITDFACKQIEWHVLSVKIDCFGKKLHISKDRKAEVIQGA